MRLKNIFSLLLIVIIFTCLINISFAANISGNVYDDSLDPLNNVIIKVDSNTPQQYISKDGFYQFELPQGMYTIQADYIEQKTIKYTVNEKINISKEGNFKLDLILFNPIENDLEEDINLDNIDIPEFNTEKGTSAFIIVLFIFLAIFLIFVGYYIYRYFKLAKNTEKLNQKMEQLEVKEFNEREKQEILHENVAEEQIQEKNQELEDKEYAKLLNILRQHKRITQKEVRAEIPLSEAKISLMISEMEHKGLVEKIKKGRGNILIYKGK